MFKITLSWSVELKEQKQDVKSILRKSLTCIKVILLQNSFHHLPMKSYIILPIFTKVREVYSLAPVS